MPIYQPKPTYYRVTWDIDTAHNYTTTGGISPLSSLQFFNTVALSGVAASPTMTDGDVLLLNNYEIGPFDSSDTVAIIVGRFNDMSQYTGVVASENWTGYITLQSVDPVDAPILLANKIGTPVEDLGLSVGTFDLINPTYGNTFTTLTNTHAIVLNGVTITFTTAGGLDIAGACATINLATSLTGVVATAWTDKIQLNTLDGSPIYFGNPAAGTATANLGFAISTAYGGAMNLLEAIAIEKAALRWKGIINTVETGLTAYLYGATVMTGSTTDGNQSPTTVAWTVGVENIDHVYALTEAGEPEAVGTVLTGAAAIKRLVARALTLEWAENRNVFNNTLTVRGALALRENPVIVQRITATAIDTVANIATIESNIAVSLISNA